MHERNKTVRKPDFRLHLHYREMLLSKITYIVKNDTLELQSAQLNIEDTPALSVMLILLGCEAVCEDEITKTKLKELIKDHTLRNGPSPLPSSFRPEGEERDWLDDPNAAWDIPF